MTPQHGAVHARIIQHRHLPIGLLALDYPGQSHARPEFANGMYSGASRGAALAARAERHTPMLNAHRTMECVGARARSLAPRGLMLRACSLINEKEFPISPADHADLSINNFAEDHVIFSFV